ncbi:MAG: N-acetylmuramoyl-L-alanine amidase family protein [Gemmatimonadales bacterium]
MQRSAWIAAVLLAGCARPPGPEVIAPQPERPALDIPGETTAPGRLPPVPESRGPLRIRVVYPDSLARVDIRDSSFIFGSVGDGTAILTINGQSVPVAANGAWLAWLPFAGDSVISFAIAARTATDSATLLYRVRRSSRFTPAPGQALWIDTTSFSPRGRVWWPRDEFLPLSVRASEDANLRLALPSGTVITLSADSVAEDVAEGIRAFDREVANLARPVRADRYRTMLRGITLGDAGPLFDTILPSGRPAVLPPTGPPSRRAVQPSSRPALELLAIRGRDTVRAVWPLTLALLDSTPIAVTLNDDRERRGGTDRLTMGRTTPGGTYTWFFPTGTRGRVSGRINGDLRLALSRRSDAWVSAAEALPSPGPTTAVVGSITLTPNPDRVIARIPVGVRLPFQVHEEERALTIVLYGARSDVNWLRYGPADPLVRLAITRQTSADELELRFDLSTPVWGYRTEWDGTDLLFAIRRPPRLDRSNVLAGMTVVVDPGHPPIGATGPTGLTEAEANLAIAQVLVGLLAREGAHPILTRTDMRPLDLWPRVRLADSLNAQLLVSIHNNALPDGINPFTNNGPSVFYHHPRALPLARAIQSRFVGRFGLRDLGVGRADLALARPTWMPAVLTEGLFLMIPEQEAALAQSEGQRLYALAVLEGIRQFLEQVRDAR